MALKTVSVKPGETLWKLAEEHMGDGQNWRDLYLLNVDQITRQERNDKRIGPDTIFPGQQLVVLSGDVKFDPSAN